MSTYGIPIDGSDVSARKIVRLIETKKSAFWMHARETQMLGLFHRAASDVPAYKDFLRKNRIDPAKIKTLRELELVPRTSKDSYLRAYPLKALAWKGSLAGQLAWTSTSGSTGEPFYFPRGGHLDWQSSIIHELFLKNSSHGTDGSTLVIVGFGMGVWIGGLLTYKAFEIAARRGGYHLSLITPGINKAEIFAALKNLAPHFSQVIFAAYPPFMKDIIDEAPAQGINLKKLGVRLLTAAEPYTEKFRHYLGKKARLGNVCRDTMSVYGSADIGTMAFETPTAIAWRRLALRDKKIFQTLFPGTAKIPTLAQYNPLGISFESADGNILITGDNTIPLLRYDIGDRGGVSDFAGVRDVLECHGIDIAHEAKKAELPERCPELPFVYVYERRDFAVKLHLHDIYPEMIRDALLAPAVRDAVTGKFTMAVKYNAVQSQYLELNLELKKGKRADKPFEQVVLASVLSAIESKASGPGNIRDFIQRPNLVKLICWPAEHPLYFKPGMKQKWVVKEPTVRLA